MGKYIIIKKSNFAKNCISNQWEHYIASQYEIDNPEYTKVILDAEDKLLWGLREDGTEYQADESLLTPFELNLLNNLKNINY